MAIYKDTKFIAKLCVWAGVLAHTNNLYSMHPLPHIIKKNIANLEATIRLLEQDSSDEEEYENEKEDENWLDNVSQALRRISGQLTHIAEQKQRRPLPTTHLTIDTSRDTENSDKNHPRIEITKKEVRELLGNPAPSSPTGSSQSKNERTRQARPLLHMPRMQAPSTFRCPQMYPIIASMSPGKTGDLCGSVIIEYITYQN